MGEANEGIATGYIRCSHIHSSKHGNWKTDRLNMFFLSTTANIPLAYCILVVEDDPTQQVAYL